jgi:RimJ/RimL family protein N-acetyltransferase
MRLPNASSKLRGKRAGVGLPRSSTWNAHFHIDMIGKFRDYGFISELPMLPDTFETARLLLRPVTVVDVDAIFDSYAQDEEVARYLIWRPHRSRSETRAYVDRCITTPSEVERTYMLVGHEDNVVQGAFALRQIAAMCWHADGGVKA